MIEWVLFSAAGKQCAVWAPTELELWLTYLGVQDGGSLAVLVEIVNGLKSYGFRAEQVWRSKQ